MRHAMNVLAEQRRAEMKIISAEPQRTPCDVCGEPATVIVRCDRARFAGFRCARDGAAVMDYFTDRGFAASSDALVSDEMAVSTGESE